MTFTKGGTDIIDQRMGFYSTKTKSRRWTMTGFSYVLDMARVNASTIFAMNKGVDPPTKLDSFNFLDKLVHQIVEPYVRERNRNGLQWLVINKMQIYLGEKFEKDKRRTPQNENGERCYLCLEKIKEVGMKKAKSLHSRSLDLDVETIQTICHSILLN